MRHTEKLILPKFQLSKCYANEIGPKKQRGRNQKMHQKLAAPIKIIILLCSPEISATEGIAPIDWTTKSETYKPQQE